MVTDFASIITSYREKCARLLKDSVAGSAEHHAYSTMLQVFESQDVLRIAMSLESQAHNIAAVDLAPTEMHAEARKARAIVAKWALDFKRDTSLLL